MNTVEKIIEALCIKVKFESEEKEKQLKYYNYNLSEYFCSKHKLPISVIETVNFQILFQTGVLSNFNNIGLDVVAPNLICHALNYPHPFIAAYKEVCEKYITPNKNNALQKKDLLPAKKLLIRLIELNIKP